MDLMNVLDSHPIAGFTMLTGTPYFERLVSRTEVEEAFGSEVIVQMNNGVDARVQVRRVWVHQALSGVYEVSVAVDLPKDGQGVKIGSIVRSSS